jgi:hypothetical protein
MNKVIIVTLFLLSNSGLAGTLSPKERTEIGWEYAKQIECIEISFYAKLFSEYDLHNLKAKKLIRSLILSGKIENEKELIGYKARGIGRTEGIEKTLNMYGNNQPSDYKKIYDYSRCR